MASSDDISRTKAKGADLIRGPRRRTSDAAGSGDTSGARPVDSLMLRHLDSPLRRADVRTPPVGVVPVRRDSAAPAARASAGRWNEGRRGQIAYLLIGLAVGAIAVASIRSDALRSLRISLARTFLPDDLEVHPSKGSADGVESPNARRSESAGAANFGTTNPNGAPNAQPANALPANVDGTLAQPAQQIPPASVQGAAQPSLQGGSQLSQGQNANAGAARKPVRVPLKRPEGPQPLLPQGTGGQGAGMGGALGGAGGLGGPAGGGIGSLNQAQHLLGGE